MKEYYVLCSRDGASNRLSYHTGKYTQFGSIYYGDVLEAKRFDSLQAAANAIAENPSEFYLGINIIMIADVTFDKLAESKDGDRVLYNKYHDPNYAIQ